MHEIADERRHVMRGVRGLDACLLPCLETATVSGTCVVRCYPDS